MNIYEYETIRRLALQGGMWSLFQYDEINPKLVQGWLVPPNLIRCEFAVLVDGKPIDLKPLPLLTSNILEIFKRFDLADSASALTFSFELDTIAQFPKETKIEIVVPSFQRTLLPFYFCDFDSLITPRPENIARTSGHRSTSIFNRTGFNEAQRLLSVFKSFSSQESASTKILDWGSGCGRISRFMAHWFGDKSVFGVDIDPLNIGWCHTHLNANQYKLISNIPRLPFSDETFDLVYGISVMTHLSLTDQQQWLSALTRVLKRNGIAILTYHGLPMFFAHVNDGDMLTKLTTQGFLDYGRNSDLDADSKLAQNSESYRNVFNILNSILKTMNGQIEIIDIIPGGHPNQHDYVIFRRR